MSIFFVIAMYAIWSSVFSLSKIALHYSPPLFLTAARMLLAGGILLLFLAFTKRHLFKLNRAQLLSIALLAFFSIYLTNALEFWGVQYLSAAKTCFIYSLSPFFSAFFSYIHFKEKMNRNKWIGMMISFIGFLPVLMMQTGSEELLNAFSFFSWPTLAIMGAVLASVYGWVLLRIVVKDQALSPVMANGASMLLGGTFALVHSLSVENWQPTPIASGQLLPFTQSLLIMTLLYNIVCYNLYGLFLKRFTATFLSFIGLLSPIFASLNAWIFLSEPISWTILFSTAIISVGLWIFYRAELKQGYMLSPRPVVIPIIKNKV
jgi:drug/metabolite transporter (DMT)-like permease